MEHKTAKLSELQASFWLSRNKLSATVEGIEQKARPAGTATILKSWISACTSSLF